MVLKWPLVEIVSPTSHFIELIKLRQREGYDYLYNEYAHIIFGMSIKLVKNVSVAEDLVQETFIKVWKNIDQYDAHKASFSTWVLNIARYTTIDYLRSKQYKQQQKNQTVGNSEYSEGLAVSINLDAMGLRNEVARLEPKYREIIDLIYLGGFTQEEAARHLNIPLGTVKTRTRFALQTLRSIMKA